MTGLAEAVRQIREGGALENARAYITSAFPDTARALRMLDLENALPRVNKGYNLVKREQRRLGYVYYVRYYHEGKMLPSKWNTHTNSREEAERFARENKAALVRGYLKAHDAQMFGLLERFYAPGSEIMAAEGKRNRNLSEKSRRGYHSVMVKKFIPFLKERGIGGYEGISAGLPGDFQDRLLAGGAKPQTVDFTPTSREY